MNFSKIEAGKLEIEAISFPLYYAVDEMVRPLALHAAQKSLRFTWEVAPDLPERVIGDPVRLRQVVTNLLANAIKFTHEGSIVLQVEREKSDGDGLALHFSVRDTGIGIPEEKQQAIFHAFTQADGSITRQFGGTGLGLSIASRLVEKMGGRVWLESAVGRGSTFHFTVRLQADRTPAPVLTIDSDAGAEPPAVCPSPPERALTVLVAEDNPVNQQLILRLLEKLGHRAMVAHNGQEAVEAFSLQRFDVILMDVQMPELDGCQATAAIRDLERASGAPPTPIIALTARAMKGDRESCLAAGMNGYLTKPIRIQELQQALQELTPARA